MSDPYRTPDAVRDLELQLADVRSERETLRAELADVRSANEKLTKQVSAMSPSVQESRTVRFVVAAIATCVLGIVFALYHYEITDLRQPEGECKDTIISVASSLNHACPHSKHVLTKMTEADKAMCSCEPVKP